VGLGEARKSTMLGNCALGSLQSRAAAKALLERQVDVIASAVVAAVKLRQDQCG
jgi:hypothetical protein